jgi:hypothetical protein
VHPTQEGIVATAVKQQASIREAHRLYRPSGRKGTKYNDEQVMLTLAMLSYRGFHDLRPTRLSLKRLESSIEAGLGKLEPVKDQWDLTWGPVTYQSTLSLFDDAAMFVLRSKTVPNRYAVVIRGTNPVSAFDWVFGDFWAGATTPWRFGDPNRSSGAALSLSTSLGLNMLRTLRSPSSDLGFLGRALSDLDEDLGGAVRAAVRRVLNPIGRGAAITLRHVRRELKREIKTIARMQRGRMPTDPEKHASRLLELRAAAGPLRGRIGRRLSFVDDVIGGETQLDVLRVMEGTAGIRNRIVQGPDLIGYLRHVVAETDEPVDVFVTGHSKGGALAVAVAAWLTDTRGMEWVLDEDQWDPDGRTTVHCYSFAGPTPGNAAFADLVTTILGPNVARTSNMMDIVPHAWAVKEHGDASGLYVDDVPWVYGPEVHHIDALEALADHVVSDVAGLEYAHVRGDVHEFTAPVDPDKTLYLEQVGYQHAGAYLEELGLAGVVDPMEVFTPFG